MPQLGPDPHGVTNKNSTQNAMPTNPFSEPSPYQARNLKKVNNHNPHVIPNGNNAPAFLTNMALPSSDGMHKIYLWIDEIETGWHMSGSVSQSAYSKNFYPKNASQMPVIIRGFMPNQYQYDRLVQFVTTHHMTVLNGNVFQPLVFKMKPLTIKARNGKQTKIYLGKNLQCFIDSISAGHQKFTYAPRFELSMTVIKDQKDKDGITTAEMNYQLQKSYEAGLLMGNPKIFEDGAPGETSQSLTQTFLGVWDQVVNSIEGIV